MRRVLRIDEGAPGRLTLEVARFGRSRPDRLEFVSAAKRARPRARASRAVLRALSRSARAAISRRRTYLADGCRGPATFSLGQLRAWNPARQVRVTGPCSARRRREIVATYDGLLTFGLLWLDRARQLARGKSIAGLRLFCPEGAGRVTAHRLQALSRSTAVEAYEYSAENWRARRLDPSDSGNLDAWLAPRREIDAVLAQARAAIEQIGRLGAGRDYRDGGPRIHATSPSVTAACSSLYGGATAFSSASATLAARSPRTARATSRRFSEIWIRTARPVATDTKHPLYRAQPERWLESLVAADPTRVDARLDPRFFYEQLPALTAGDRGVMDAVAMTRSARLAVIEFKASEDVQLVLQAVDYWLRVRWHHAQQDFSRYGYFPGIDLDPAPATAVSRRPGPALSSGERVILQFLSPEIEICRVGVGENWRRGVKVVLRQGQKIVP